MVTLFIDSVNFSSEYWKRIEDILKNYWNGYLNHSKLLFGYANKKEK